jgi:hypothetical protein
MQGLATTREKPLAQEQWKTMKNTVEKTMRRAMETAGHSAGGWRVPSYRRPAKTIARRREAPGVEIHD